MNKMMAILAFVPMIICTGCSTNGCTPAEQQETVAVITNGGACLADIVLDVNGVEDIATLAAACGATASDIYQLVSQLLNHQPASDAAVPARSMAPEMQAHLRRIQDNANLLIFSQ
jgi:hypothetical protein